MEDKNKSQQSNSEISICDIMKDNTSQIIRKMESQIPSFVQNHSDMYSAYLHMYDDLFGTCYLSEKEFFDRLNIDKKYLEQIKKNLDLIKDVYLENLDNSTNLLDMYTKMQVSLIKSLDNNLHTIMQTYSNSVSQFNKLINHHNKDQDSRTTK